MKVEPLTPFGAAVHDASVNSPTLALAEALAMLVAQHRVIVLRDARIDDATMVALIASFGEPMFTEGEIPVPRAPMLNIVSNVGRTKPPRSVFHTDSSYMLRPPALTFLRPVELPVAGGGTLFSDQVAAAKELSERLTRQLKGRTVLHGVTGLDRDETSRHALLRRHPLTGETALYLSTPERCSALDDVDPKTSRRIIDVLYRRSIRPSTLYRHFWQRGDLLIWDNRVTMHRAEHGDVAGDRVLHRGMVRGEVPIAA